MFKILTILSAVLVGLNANAKPGQTYNWTDFESTDVYINILGQGSTEAAEQAAQNMIEALSQGEVPSNQIWAPFANDVDCNSAGAKSVISKYLKKQLNKGHQKVSGLSYTVSGSSAMAYDGEGYSSVNGAKAKVRATMPCLKK